MGRSGGSRIVGQLGLEPEQQVGMVEKLDATRIILSNLSLSQARLNRVTSRGKRLLSIPHHDNNRKLK